MVLAEGPTGVHPDNEGGCEQDWLGNNGFELNGHVPDFDPFEEADGRIIKWRTASQVRDDVPEWGWEYDGRGRIQLATLALLAGRPGAGKSTAARFFAAGYSLGAMPGCFVGKPQHVAYIASEESVEYMVKPSLRAHGADMNYVHFPCVEIAGNEVRLSSVEDELALTKDLLARRITVVFVDPVMSAIGSKVDINKNNEVREVVEPWARIARAINGVVFGIVHLVKAPGGDIVAAINGSSAFGEIARSVFAFAKDHQSDEGMRVMSQEKNSAGTEDLALEYLLVPVQVETDSGRSAEAVRFTICGTSSRRVSDVLQLDPKKRGVASDGTKTAEVLQIAHELGEDVTAPMIAGKVGVSPDTAGKLLRYLEQAGLMTKVGRGRFRCRQTALED
ncbi:AAA family ATPase [Mycobacterium sp. E2327]|uniref:AAA family ATPase n=1 Tax=Mycobacterium sp. E2327 TaxID=1834132 RepID=UPI0009EE0FC1|nr:AAA family ATPase [Mycobacterium sp. E2327]